MGLDIIAYGRLRRVECTAVEDCDCAAGECNCVYIGDCGHEVLFVNPDFRETAAPLESGCYEMEDPHNVHDFRAGSYSGYNEWRQWLAGTMLDVTPEQVWENPEAFAGRPFFELINFSDCEGVIGPVVAAKLARDFAEHAARSTADDDWYTKKYQDWHRAFEIAADGGAVCFM